ncbi:winged helix-turn-helix transcriptional regulator [Thermopolyspora sp. NPDC052614]|uniref:winged helix-turn-helix transcriptional regulator n=1 Tax=Thermopolyspora sp. NPDC052614 TaxID=3155682 RepID=UPI00344ADB57
MSSNAKRRAATSCSQSALRRPEHNGMIVRTVLPTSPVGVEYSLTPLGRSFSGAVRGHVYEMGSRERG